MKKILILLIIPFLSFSQYVNPVFPYSQMEGWSSIDSASCSGWMNSGFSLGFASYDTPRCNVNGPAGFIAGSWENIWFNGPGDDAFISSFYLNSGEGTNYSIRLQLNSGDLTDSVELNTYEIQEGANCEYVDCSGWNNFFFSDGTWYTPIDFEDFNIPLGLGVTGAHISYYGPESDIGQVIITDNAIPIHSSEIKEENNRKNLLRSIDILGGEALGKGFQLHIYDDGSVEKKYLIE